MKLQEKLKNSNPELTEKPSISFITEKDAQKINVKNRS
jgi:hypothetical protein